MRTREGIFGEMHGKPMLAYEFFAAPGRTLDQIITAAEAQLGVKLRAQGGEQHGYVNSGVQADGTMYVAIYLYPDECTDPNCPLGHMQSGVVRRAAPVPKAAVLTAMMAAAGEHPTLKLGQTEAQDDAILDARGLQELKASYVRPPITNQHDESVGDMTPPKPAAPAAPTTPAPGSGRPT